MGLPKAILAGPCVGEMYWELARFAPHVLWLKKSKHKNAKLIVLTREDRFDIYGLYADILVPLRIDGDGEKYKADCFRLKGFSREYVDYYAKAFRDQFTKRFNIIEHVYPRLEKKAWQQKQPYKSGQMLFEFKPRTDNFLSVSKNVPNNKLIVVLGPRYRRGLRRNWENWQEFYNLIYEDKIFKHFTFIICGKKGEYVADDKNRFLDINNFEKTVNTSPIGLTLEVIKRAFLVVGSQSAIPNLGMLFGTTVLEWGHQKHFHTVSYNIFKNKKIHFIEDFNYRISASEVLKQMKKILKEKIK